METQFPVSRLSKESHKERKANYSQTLTGLGKWWGRKPLVMVRAVILGLLIPASDDPRKDREVFLALLTMDEDGLWRRKQRAIPLKEIYRRLSPRERAEWFVVGADPDRPKLQKGTGADDKERLQRLVFERLGYDEKLVWCCRPEHTDGPSADAWEVINKHLGTTATGIPELVHELGKRRFGHVPRVGDAFCGGGSVPFEAARIGCEAYGSDLNPVAALLTWGALEVIGGGEEVTQRVRKAQAEVYEAVDRQITDWRIEHNQVGWRADAFLYCTETMCPECGWRVPLAPSWVIGEKTRAVAQLTPKPEEQCFAIDIRSGVSQAELAAARKAGTVRNSRIECPNPRCKGSTPMAAIRGDRRSSDGRSFGLRQWNNDDFVPRPDYVFQERLYCVRWRLPSLVSLLWAEQRQRAGEAAAAPLPDWIDLDSAIAALAELLGADEQRQLGELRERDWLAEDRVLEKAQSDYKAKRHAGSPKHEVMAAKGRFEELGATVTERNARIRAIANGLPGSLYRGVEVPDLEREARALALLRERFPEWQALGYIPSRAISPGDKTDEPIRTRGWTHWHQLFTPRQLLTNGSMNAAADDIAQNSIELVACIPAILIMSLFWQIE